MRAKDELMHPSVPIGRWIHDDWDRVLNDILHCFPKACLSTNCCFYITSSFLTCVCVFYIVVRTIAEWYIPLLPVLCFATTAWELQPLMLQILSLLFLALFVIMLILYPFFHTNRAVLRNLKFFELPSKDRITVPVEVELLVMEDFNSTGVAEALAELLPSELVELCRQYSAPEATGLERWRQAEQAAWLVSEVCYAASMRFEPIRTFPLYVLVCDVLETKTTTSRRELTMTAKRGSRSSQRFMAAGIPLRYLGPQVFHKAKLQEPTGVASLDLVLENK